MLVFLHQLQDSYCVVFKSNLCKWKPVTEQCVVFVNDKPIDAMFMKKSIGIGTLEVRKVEGGVLAFGSNL